MRKLASIALAAAAFALPAADMASQKWVDMKIREAQGLRKADIFAQAKAMLDDKLLITKATQPLAFSMGTNGMLFASFARRTVYALMATNSLNATIPDPAPTSPPTATSGAVSAATNISTRLTTPVATPKSPTSPNNREL